MREEGVGTKEEMIAKEFQEWCDKQDCRGSDFKEMVEEILGE